MKGKTYPGLNKKEMLELCPDLEVGREKVTDTQGWFEGRNDHIETEEEMGERIKEVLREMKEWHRQNPNQVILCISHGCFLRMLMSILTQQTQKIGAYQSANNSMTIVDFSDERNEGIDKNYVEARLMGYNI